MTVPAEEMLRGGSSILEPLLLKHGFSFLALDAGSSSGGRFATGAFCRATRRLELHFRHSLGMVTYHLGNRSMSHEAYMRSVLGVPFASHYPGFSDDPLDAFRHRHFDLEKHGQEFLDGTDSCFLRRMDDALAISKRPSYLPG